MPEEVCDLRPSPLQALVVDCSVECEIPECCTSCVPDSQDDRGGDAISSGTGGFVVVRLLPASMG